MAPGATYILQKPDIQDLAVRGHLRLRLRPQVVRLVEEIADRARGFFRQSVAAKRRARLEGVHEGWQPFGGEFSISPDRPDLHESFWVTRGRAAAAAAYACPLGRELHGRMLDYLEIVQDLESQITQELLDWLGVDRSRPPYPRSLESDLQVLFYQPARESRELLQDPHEDSLSLTFTWADQPGLELLGRDGAYQPVALAPNELAVLPGEILSLMTGRRVVPQMHRVMRHSNQSERVTLSYFSAPDDAPDTILEPWVTGSGIDAASLRERVRSNRLKYLVP